MNCSFNRLNLAAAVAVASLAFAAPSQAQITWNWSINNGDEAGTFVTNGSLVGGLAPAATYTISDATVIASAFVPTAVGGSISGGQFTVNQPTIGFVWDGTNATQFFRSNGSLTNGAAFASSSANRDWSFSANSSSQTLNIRRSTSPNTPATGAQPLTLSAAPAAAAAPEPGSLALFGTMGVPMGLVAVRKLRRRK